MLGFLHVIAIEVFLTLCFFSGHVHTLCFKILLFERLDGQIMIERASQKKVSAQYSNVLHFTRKGELDG